MPQPNTQLDDLLDLIRELQELPKIDSEIANKRFTEVTREVYKVMRKALSMDTPRTYRLLITAQKGLNSDEPRIAASSALFLEMFSTYIRRQEGVDPAQFSDDIITALDIAVQKIRLVMEESFNDTSTEQST